MKDEITLTIELLTAIAGLLGPGGSRAIIAENLLLKQQLLVHSRSRHRAPNLSVRYRVLFGFWTLFLSPRRIARSAIIIKPLTAINDKAKPRTYARWGESGAVCYRGWPALTAIGCT